MRGSTQPLALSTALTLVEQRAQERSRKLQSFLHKILKASSYFFGHFIEERTLPISSSDEPKPLLELLERSPNFVCLFSGPDHVFQVANEQCRRAFGTRDLVGKRARDVLPVEGFQTFLDTLDRVYRSEESFAQTEMWIPAFGSEKASAPRFVDFQFQPFKSQEESFDGVMVHGTDITAQVRAREKIAIEDQRFRLAGEAIPYGVWEADANGAINYVGKQMLALLGARPEDVNGINWAQYIHPEDLPKLLYRVNVTMPRGEPFEDEFLILGADHRYHYVLSKARPVRDASGRVTSWVGLHLDINEQKNRERELLKSERRFRMLAEHSPALIWSTLPNGDIDYTNQRWLELSGYDPASGLNPSKGWMAGLHPDDLPKYVELWKQSLEKQVPFNAEGRVRGRDGRYRWFLSNAQPIFDEDNKLQSWLGVSIDMTEKKEAELALIKAKEAAESANHLKTAFLANMSHEIRTPLGAIMGFSELLVDENAPPSEREKFKEVVVRSGQELTHLIDDILDLSKVETNRLEISKSRTPLKTLLDDVIEVMAEKAKQKQITLTAHLNESAPQAICTDPHRLKQILSNLIDNGIKFTPSGGWVAVNVGSVVRAGTHNVEFTVCDSGQGLSQSDQEKIFQPFLQGDNSMTRTYGGTGLGLSLSKRLARALDGDVHLLRSIPNQGSTFSVIIPWREFSDERPREEPQSKKEPEGQSEKVPEKVPGAPSAAPSAAQGNLTGHRILLVEDSKDNQELIKRMLSKNGAIIDVADNGLEGVEKALGSPHDAILMDIQMPKMDGLEAMRALKEKGLNTPVIALTAHAMREEKERSMSAGFTDHLTKPVSRTVLIETLVRHMSH